MYEVELDAELPADAEAAFADGRIVLDGAPCAPAQLRRTGPRSAEVTLMEGKYHQVKRMFAAQVSTVLAVLFLLCPVTAFSAADEPSYSRCSAVGW